MAIPTLELSQKTKFNPTEAKSSGINKTTKVGEQLLPGQAKVQEIADTLPRKQILFELAGGGAVPFTMNFTEPPVDTDVSITNDRYNPKTQIGTKIKDGKVGTAPKTYTMEPTAMMHAKLDNVFDCMDID